MTDKQKIFKAYCNTESHIQCYECQVIAKNKEGKLIGFDGCLWQEIFWLWNKGITTLGCCCGHHIDDNEDNAYIQVNIKDVSKMLELGYEYQNKDVCAFKPKTKIEVLDANKT